LRTMNVDAELRDLAEGAEGAEFGPYDAAVIGSAVYLGRWMAEAVAFVRRQKAALRPIPVWLFSSGPLGDAQPQPLGEPHQLDELMVAARARGHRLFSGRLDKTQLGLGERLIIKAVHAPVGDFRDWDDVRGWAREIGETLLGTERVRGEPSSSLNCTGGLPMGGATARVQASAGLSAAYLDDWKSATALR
jgi:menaquinone-dependent protoporphyrinogen oxidase